ncbi:hypothetical protein Patl1_31033 [Pistacia atlantica]|uniref:Uncharacterized protein n=1 Tax=Pistacia atlantica TaxID=434234 RepID=A0ACC1ACE6_9ROSI|nr:hypothetical protein Patl1_31033 [Pistacia atlantica]
MASTIKVNAEEEEDDEAEEEELERFDDFTLPSSWESIGLRFIYEIEAICRQWLGDGPKNLLVFSCF